MRVECIFEAKHLFIFQANIYRILSFDDTPADESDTFKCHQQKPRIEICTLHTAARTPYNKKPIYHNNEVLNPDVTRQEEEKNYRRTRS